MELSSFPYADEFRGFLKVLSPSWILGKVKVPLALKRMQTARQNSTMWKIEKGGSLRDAYSLSLLTGLYWGSWLIFAQVCSEQEVQEINITSSSPDPSPTLFLMKLM